MPNQMDADRLRHLLTRAVEAVNPEPPSKDKLAELAGRARTSRRMMSVVGGVLAVAATVATVLLVVSLVRPGRQSPTPAAGASDTPTSSTASSPTTTSSSPSATSTTASPAPPACAMSNIHVANISVPIAVTHWDIRGIYLTNTGNAPCSLDGYPSLSITKPDGSSVPVVTKHFCLDCSVNGASMLTDTLQQEHAATPAISQDQLITERVTLAPGGDVPFFMQSDIDNCAGPDFVTLQIGGAGATGSIAVSPYNGAQFCADHATYVTPVMELGTKPFPVEPAPPGIKVTESAHP